jgi:hypothetical protein
MGVSAVHVAATPTNGGVTGVTIGDSNLTIAVGTDSFNANANWYFPTQADGTVHANGIIYLQHGAPLAGDLYTSLATTLAQRTDSIVVSPTLPVDPFPWLCADCYLNSPAMERGVAQLFLGDRAALTTSAGQAGFQGTLPQSFTFSGHSVGGDVAVASAGYYENELAPGAPDNLLGVVLFDGVAAAEDDFDDALNSLKGKPVYQITSPPTMWNNNDQATKDLIAARPGQFVGAELLTGVHFDSMVGSHPLIDFLVQLVSGWSTPSNRQALDNLADGWINDFYTHGTPQNPNYGFYGTAGQPIIMIQTEPSRARSARHSPPPPRSENPWW